MEQRRMPGQLRKQSGIRNGCRDEKLSKYKPDFKHLSNEWMMS